MFFGLILALAALAQLFANLEEFAILLATLSENLNEFLKLMYLSVRFCCLKQYSSCKWIYNNNGIISLSGYLSASSIQCMCHPKID